MTKHSDEGVLRCDVRQDSTWIHLDPLARHGVWDMTYIIQNSMMDYIGHFVRQTVKLIQPRFQNIDLYIDM